MLFRSSFQQLTLSRLRRVTDSDPGQRLTNSLSTDSVMSSFPTFLKQLSTKKSSSEGGLHSFFTHSERLGSDEAHCIWWPARTVKHPSKLILFIPGFLLHCCQNTAWSDQNIQGIQVLPISIYPFSIACTRRYRTRQLSLPMLILDTRQPSDLRHSPRIFYGCR